MVSIPTAIPRVRYVDLTVDTPADQSAFFGFDVAIGGQGFRLASDTDNPMVWMTAPYTRQQIDQGYEAGEQTLSTWWLKSQSSFHGGAGQLQLERPDLQPNYTHIRFDTSKNVDVWTPGRVTRLPDTRVVHPDTPSRMLGVSTGGVDYAAYVDPTGKLAFVNLTGIPVKTVCTAITETVSSITVDGPNIFAAALTGIYRVSVAAPTLATKIATYPADATAVVRWVKARLMLGTAGGVYELNGFPASPPVATSTAGLLRYQHPTAGWTWRTFCEAPAAILAVGDAGSRSDVVQFTLDNSGGTPVLAVGATIVSTAPGERILSMTPTMGTFIGVGTTSGFRVAQFNSLYSYLTLGPLTQPATDTTFPVHSSVARDRFLYFAGYAGDEPGLSRVDLGTVTDQAGRFAYAPDLIGPVVPPDLSKQVMSVALTPSNKVVFSVPGVGICVEGTGPGTVREAWIRSSRIRYGTAEPKLFKLGRVRGDFTAGEADITGIIPTGSSRLGTVGFTTVDPGEFRLPDGPAEWLQLQIALLGAPVVLSGWGTKALPGTRKQKLIQVTLEAADRETDRRGRRHVDIGTSRARVDALFALDATGDEVLFEEFTLAGTARSRVVLQKVQFTETGRPTNTSDFGGKIQVTMQTVET